MVTVAKHSAQIDSEKETSLETDRKNGENLRKLLVIKHKSSSTFPEKSVGEGGGGVTY